MSFLLSLLAAAAVSGAAPLEPAAAETEAPAEADEPKAEEKICRRVAAGMDSRRKQKVCLTAREWRELNGSRYQDEDR